MPADSCYDGAEVVVTEAIPNTNKVCVDARPHADSSADATITHPAERTSYDRRHGCPPRMALRAGGLPRQRGRLVCARAWPE